MQQEVKTKPASKNINKPAYALFLITGIIFMVIKDFPQASIFWGLALIFDPFDIKQPFNKRPAYQQLWLIAHLSISLALFVLMIINK